MKMYDLKDKISLNNEELEVKNLTLEDLYNLYEKYKLISLVKIINGDVKLYLEEE